jgi:glycosyltransferase involved in cell wall biosynthesis
MNLGVVLQCSLRINRGRYLVKEQWGEYIDNTLAPLFDTVELGTVIDSVTLTSPFQTQSFRSQNLEVHAWPDLHAAEGWKERLSTLIDLCRHVYRFVVGVDVLWVFMPTYRGALAGMISRWLGRPYVVYIGGDWAELTCRNAVDRSVKRYLERLVVAGARFVLVRGSYLSLRYSQWRQKVFLAAPAVQLTVQDIARRERHWPLAPMRCLYVGGLLEMKGLRYLLEAMKLLVDEGSCRFHLSLIGASLPDNAYQKQAQEAGLSEHVSFRGYVPNGPALFRLYRKADVFILPTLSEGFPRVLIEAMAFGLAVITTPVGGIPDAMAHEKNCLFVPVRSAKAIAEALLRLSNDRELFFRLVEGGYRTAEELLRQDAAAQVFDLFTRFHLLPLPKKEPS